MIQLRNYQVVCLQAIREHYRNGVRRQIVHLPTAAGKSVIFGSLIAQSIKAEPSTKALVLAFSCDLLTNARDKIKMISPELDVGIVDAEHKEFNRQIVVSSIQSARKPANLKRLQEQGFKIAIADEAHHFASESARHVLNGLGFSKDGCAEGDQLLCGFSATPFRQDSLGLAEVFDKIVYHKSTKEMIEEGFLTRPQGHRVATDLDLSSLAIENGDYATSALSMVMNTDPINQLVVDSYLQKAAGRKAIAFTTSIAHSVALADWFRKFGVVSEPIHSDFSRPERDELLKRYQDGNLEVLVNPLLLAEGVDLPCTSCVIVARPTKSPGLFTQMIGRGLRLFPNKKECIILDFGDKDHTLCNVGILLDDDTSETPERPQNNTKMTDLFRGLPPSINPKLKAAILSIDLFSESFTWQKDHADGCYLLKAAGDSFLKIVKRGEDRYDAVFFSSKNAKTIAGNLDFQYAFSTAEDFVRVHRHLFAISDLEAPWRQLPISDKQKDLFRSFGFRNGIDDLSRGQAATIISSGVLKRKGRY